MATNNSINLKSSGICAYDGAGTFSAISVTQHAVPVGGATSQALTSLSVGTNGQLLIGSTGADPAFATVTGTGGITFTTGAASWGGFDGEGNWTLGNALNTGVHSFLGKGAIKK